MFYNYGSYNKLWFELNEIVKIIKNNDGTYIRSLDDEKSCKTTKTFIGHVTGELNILEYWEYLDEFEKLRNKEN